MKYSAHIFVFPFKWRTNINSKNTSFKHKVDISKVKGEVESSRDWVPFSFEPKPEADYFNSYNEFVYFHDYARDLLGISIIKSPVGKGVLQYEFDLFSKDNAKYIIEASEQPDGPYELRISSITLNFYESGTGVLAFHLLNEKHELYDDILRINDFGRRLFPQFLGGKANVENLLSSPQGVFLAKKLSLTGVKKEAIIEDFLHYADQERIKKAPFVMPRLIGELLGGAFITEFDDATDGKICLSPTLDDRMFIQCFVFNDDLIEKLSVYDEKEKCYAWEEDNDWYRLIFVDGSKTPTIDSRNMKRELLKASTYDRWVESKNKQGKASGHIFGISRYSFVILANRNWFTENIALHHFSNLYFQMALLSLVQRVTVLSFSTEVAEIATNLDSAKRLSSRVINNIAELYLQYINFIQKIYFREITPQEQGIELYNIMQNRLGIKNDVEDLNREMSELNQFVEAQQQKNISVITYVLLPATILLGFFGLNYFSSDALYFDLTKQFVFSGSNFSSVVIIVLLTIFLSMLSSRLMQRFIR